MIYPFFSTACSSLILLNACWFALQITSRFSTPSRRIENHENVFIIIPGTRGYIKTACSYDTRYIERCDEHHLTICHAFAHIHSCDNRAKNKNVTLVDNWFNDIGKRIWCVLCALAFYGIDLALFSQLTYLCATRTVSWVDMMLVVTYDCSKISWIVGQRHIFLLGLPELLVISNRF